MSEGGRAGTCVCDGVTGARSEAAAGRVGSGVSRPAPALPLVPWVPCRAGFRRETGSSGALPAWCTQSLSGFPVGTQRSRPRRKGVCKGRVVRHGALLREGGGPPCPALCGQERAAKAIKCRPEDWPQGWAVRTGEEAAWKGWAPAGQEIPPRAYH